MIGCGRDESTSVVGEIENYPGLVGSDVYKMEKLIPNNLFDSNYVAIWRDGSIFFVDGMSALVVEKKQLKDKQLICHYFVFKPMKPSNYRNWNFSKTYELTLENEPFDFPLNDQVSIREIDSIVLECHCEGIEANSYFMKDFNSDKVYPVNDRYNPTLINNISKLFKQISKKEHVQTLSLTGDSIDYQEVNKLIRSKDLRYCIEEDGKVGSLQRHYGDK